LIVALTVLVRDYAAALIAAGWTLATPSGPPCVPADIVPTLSPGTSVRMVVSGVLVAERFFEAGLRAMKQGLGRAAGQLGHVPGEGLRGEFEALGHGRIGAPRAGYLRHGHLVGQGVDGGGDDVPAPSARICAPSSRPLPVSATSLMAPRVPRLTSARGTADSGRTRHSHAYPCATAWAWVSPALAKVGVVKVTAGRCR
jgi:hypothetical protein